MPTRREILALVPAALASRLASSAEPSKSPQPAAKPSDVNATEDLMREHGVLRRVLIVYEEGARRLAKGEEASVTGVLAQAAGIVQHFVEAYHEILEEQFVFPRFDKHPTLGPLCATLRAQHVVGRRLTQTILTQAQLPVRSKPDRLPLIAALNDFGHMYAAHAAREDTELFPAFHALYTEKEFDALGDQFEEQEGKLLGKDGFEGAVKLVGDLEKQLGIGDLAVFTPK